MKKSISVLAAVISAFIVGCNNSASNEIGAIDQSNPEAVAGGIIQSWIDGDARDFVKKYASEKQTPEMLENGHKGLANRYRQYKGANIIKVEYVGGNDELLTMKVYVRKQDFRVDHFDIPLTKRDGKWWLKFRE